MFTVSEHEAASTSTAHLTLFTPCSFFSQRGMFHTSPNFSPLLTDSVVHKDNATSGMYFLILWVTQVLKRADEEI